MKKTKINFSLLEDNKTNSILFFSLFSVWLLSFPFLGTILHSLYGSYNIDLGNLSLKIIIFSLIGLILPGYFIDKLAKAISAVVFITKVSILGSLVFYRPYSALWNIMILLLSFIGGAYIAVWGFYLKRYKNIF